MRRYLPIVPLLIAILAGCAGNPPEPTTGVGDPCRVSGPHDGTGPDTVWIAASPTEWGANDYMRLFIVNRFPTLITVDCNGDIRPGLAEIESGAERRWVLKIRNDIRFANGEIAGPGDVVDSWRQAIALGAGVDSVVALDNRRVEVFLERPGIEALASPDLMVRSSRDSAAPLKGAPGFTFGAPEDPRDMLARTSILLSRDPGLVAYAEERGMVVFELPYDRTYMLLAPSRVRDVSAAAGPAHPSPDLRRDLAAAVREGEVRAAGRANWWTDLLDGCGPLVPVPASMAGLPDIDGSVETIFYDEEDAVARDLSERIVALTATDTLQSRPARDLFRSLPAIRPGNVVARGISAEVLQGYLEAGKAFAFVTSVRNPVEDTCGSARDLFRRAPWLAAGGADLRDVVLELVDLSSYVILTNSNVTVTWDIYGNVRIVPPPAELP